MATISAQDIQVGMEVKNHHGAWVAVKDVFKSPINGRVYATYEALDETATRLEDEDIMYPRYTVQVEVRA